jgi:tetratricopeptide (TPR) repeat protein
MRNDSIYKTRTMARIQEEQGRWAEAEEIYRHLLKQDPRNDELITGLARVQSRMNPLVQGTPERMVDLLDHWLELLLIHEKSIRLKQARKSLNR